MTDVTDRLQKLDDRIEDAQHNIDNLIPSCPQCGNRLFSIYIGGIKERVEDEMWCKVCKKPQKVRVKISYS